MRKVALLLLLALLGCARAAETPWPAQFVEKHAGHVVYVERCTAKPGAIVLYLHAWTSTYREPEAWPQLAAIRHVCIVSPEFNAPDGTPACGSDAAMAAVKAAVDAARAEHHLSRVVLLGYSGGGYMSLMTLGRFPHLAEGASVWLPIFDLAKWYAERPGHRKELEHCFGGPPSAEYLRRSPATALEGIHAPHVVINAGTHDEETPDWHAKAAAKMIGAAYVEHDAGHQFLPEIAAEQVNDLLMQQASRTR